MGKAQSILADFTHPLSCDRPFKIPYCLVLALEIDKLTDGSDIKFIALLINLPSPIIASSLVINGHGHELAHGRGHRHKQGQEHRHSIE
jgi:hypothetical protein